MCGIFFYYGEPSQDLEDQYYKIQHRGPSNSKFYSINVNDKQMFFGFHRLSVNGLDEQSNQPFIQDGIYLLCNGEIFNYKELLFQFHFHDVYVSNSDCEIIIHLYKKFGIEKTVEMLDGEFAFVLYDDNTKKIHIARDVLGIRSLYMGNHENNWIFSSEMKAIEKIYDVQQFSPRTYMTISIENGEHTDKLIMNPYFVFHGIQQLDCIDEERIHIQMIRELMIKAVNKRLMSDRRLCCLLSGGLDSTIVTALVAMNYDPYQINTYSIGLKESVDLKYSVIAAQSLQTNHTCIELTPREFIDAIDKTIYQIESYDVTTVRASIGNYLVSCYIRDNSEDKVVFCGDVSDEIFGSYRGFFYANNETDFFEENMKMVENIHYFDVLRSDKSISGAGLEARVPFSDPELIQYVMSIKPCYKMFSKEKMEKYLLRKAFDDVLPDELLWRVKTAFSDGVSNEENPAYKMIQDFMENKYSNQEFEEKRKQYVINPPYDKESLYYREIFESYYENKGSVIPYFWKQPFMTNDDPSAWNAEKNQKEIS